MLNPKYQAHLILCLIEQYQPNMWYLSGSPYESGVVWEGSVLIYKPLTLTDNLGQPSRATELSDQSAPLIIGRGKSGLNPPDTTVVWAQLKKIRKYRQRAGSQATEHVSMLTEHLYIILSRFINLNVHIDILSSPSEIRFRLFFLISVVLCADSSSSYTPYLNCM